MTWPAPPDDAALAAAREKILAGLASSEKALAAQSADYAQAVEARVLIKAASDAPKGEVDALAVEVVVERATAALALLNKAEKDAARDLPKLQLLASASATLSKELQAFADLAARLKAARPRGIALDPAPAEARQAPPAEAPAEERVKLKEFSAFRKTPTQRRRLVALWALCALFAAAVVRAVFSFAPQVEEVQAESAQVRISGAAAAVTVPKGWTPAALPQLLQELRARHVETAAIVGVGQLDVKSGKLYGPRTAAPPSPAPASR